MTITAHLALTDNRSALVSHWISADGQGACDMSGATAAEALEELLDVCTDDAQRTRVLAGRFEVLTDRDGAILRVGDWIVSDATGADADFGRILGGDEIAWEAGACKTDTATIDNACTRCGDHAEAEALWKERAEVCCG